MIVVGDDPKAPFWKDVLPGVRVRFRPVDGRAWRAAKRASGEALGEVATGDDDERLELAGEAFSMALLQRGIIAWEGIGDLDGEPIEPTRDSVKLDRAGEPMLDDDGLPIVIQGTISRLLSDPVVMQAFDDAYVMPFALKKREGNVSGGSPNGTSATVTPAKGIASSPAKGRRAAGAPSAHIGKTPSKRRMRKRSGPSSKDAGAS